MIDQLHFRPLRPDDLPALMRIEEAVFPLPWPCSAYESELRRDQLSRYYALESTAHDPALLLGYAGFWLIADEAHLMTIAVDPGWQGRGLGKWLLLETLDAMSLRGADIATLEVRAGNVAAQAIYRWLDFAVVGRRRHYYNDNNEDALIMTTPPLTSPAMLALRQRRRAEAVRRLQAYFPESE